MSVSLLNWGTAAGRAHSVHALTGEEKRKQQLPTRLEMELRHSWILPGPYREGDSRECHPTGLSRLVMDRV